MKKKNRLFCKKLKLKTTVSITKYNQCKKIFQKKLKISKEEYFKSKLLDASGNLKKKWDIIRLIINKNKFSSSYCPIQNTLLGRHYSTVAERLHSKLNIESCMLNDMDMPRHKNRFCFNEVSEYEVYENILHMNSSKGPGPDGVCFFIYVIRRPDP